jgi:hypothetical protein
MHDPSPEAYEAVIALLIFAYHHREHSIITYSALFEVPTRVPSASREGFLKSLGFHMWTDASWMLRSPAGFVEFLLGGPVDWASKLIRVICHSSSEAEIGAGCFGGKRCVFATLFLQEFSIPVEGPLLMFIDNSAADDLTKKFGVGPKTAHFLRWQHYLRWLVQHRYVVIVFVGTKEQLADGLTKVLDISTYFLFCFALYRKKHWSSKA